MQRISALRHDLASSSHAALHFVLDNTRAAQAAAKGSYLAFERDLEEERKLKPARTAPEEPVPVTIDMEARDAVRTKRSHACRIHLQCTAFK